MKTESIVGICGLAVAALAILATVFQNEAKDFSCSSLGLFCPAEATLSVRGFDAWVGPDGMVPSMAGMLLDMHDEPLKCGDSLASEQIASAPRLLEGPVFFRDPEPNLPNHPQGLIGDDTGATPARSLFWDLALNFHRQTKTILTITPTFQHDGTDLDPPRTLHVDTGGNSQCELRAPLLEPLPSEALGDYTLYIHITGLGIEPVSAKYDFKIVR